MVHQLRYGLLIESMEGVYTIETLCNKLNVNRKKAIYIIHRLRKLGLVRTSYGEGKRRIYFISRQNKQNRESYTEKINEVSPIQIASSNPYYIHGRKPTFEEALIYALKQKDIRYTLASLALFRKIKDWSLLYRIAKKERLLRKTVALYEVARKYISKVRKMPKRFLNLAKKEKKYTNYIVKPYSSKDFNQIERKWKVYLPFNNIDLEDYSK